MAVKTVRTYTGRLQTQLDLASEINEDVFSRWLLTTVNLLMRLSGALYVAIWPLQALCFCNVHRLLILGVLYKSYEAYMMCAVTGTSVYSGHTKVASKR